MTSLFPSPNPLRSNWSVLNMSNAWFVQLNAPINVKLQGGGGGGGGRADPGEFDIFVEASVKFPTPGHLQTVKFPHPREPLEHHIPALE